MDYSFDEIPLDSNLTQYNHVYTDMYNKTKDKIKKYITNN